MGPSYSDLTNAQGEEKWTCRMPLAALAASGGFVMARKASDTKAKKEENRAAQRGLPLVPEIDLEYVYTQFTDLRYMAKQRSEIVSCRP